MRIRRNGLGLLAESTAHGPYFGAKDRCQRAGKDVSWALILEEECAEALACKNVDDLDLELAQVAATAIRWKEAIARRRV